MKWQGRFETQGRFEICPYGYGVLFEMGGDFRRVNASGSCGRSGRAGLKPAPTGYGVLFEMGGDFRRVNASGSCGRSGRAGLKPAPTGYGVLFEMGGDFRRVNASGGCGRTCRAGLKPRAGLKLAPTGGVGCGISTMETVFMLLFGSSVGRLG